MPRRSFRFLIPLTLLATSLTGTVASGTPSQLIVSHIDPPPLQQPFSGLSLQRQWTVARPQTTPPADQHLRSLTINTFGRVFIEYATDSDAIDWQSNELAKVIVFSNVTEVLDIIEVAPAESDGAELRVKNENADARGRVFSKIVVRETAVLRSLELRGSADVVVGDNVFESTTREQGEASVSMTISGSGDLDVGLSSELAVKTLDLSIHGTGDIRVNAPTIAVLDVLQVSVDGSGDVLVAAESVDLADITIELSGSGDIVVDASLQHQASKCSVETVHISGSGDVNTASAACNTVDIDLTGLGDVKFQALDQLSVSVDGLGDLTYMNALPAHVDLSGSYSRRHLRSLLHHGELSQKHHYRSDAITEYRSGNVECVVIVHVVASSTSAGDPTMHVVEYSPNNWSYDSGLVYLAVVGFADIGVLAIALGAGAAVGLAILALLHRHRRQGYAVLS